MLRRGVAGEEREYLELSFAGGDRLFVPVEQADRVTRYAGGERPQPPRSAARSGARQERVRKAVADIAEELLALYAARAGAQGHAFAADTPWQHEMEAPSRTRRRRPAPRHGRRQGRHGAARPMDRLIVGDVGYGKTEVALRAAFKAVEDGKQVAVLVPTTVLAQQHFATFSAAARRLPAARSRCSRGSCRRKEQAETHRGPGGRDRRRRHRHAPAAVARTCSSRTWGWWSSTRSSASAWPQGAAQAAAERGRRPDADGDADPAHAAHGAGRHPRHEHHRDAARGAPADPDLRRGGVGRPRPRGDPARAGPRRPGLLRPQPGPDDRGRPSSSGSWCRTRGSSSGTARCRRSARAGDARLRRRRGRRPGLHDDHRVGPGHPEREHDHHRPRRHARAGAALPAARAGGSSVAAGLRLPAVPPPGAALGRGAQAAAGDLQGLRAGRRVPDRAARPGDPRRRQPPRRRAARPHRGGRLRPVHAPAGRGGRGAEG